MSTDPQWWRFTGVAGLKRFMTNDVIQSAIKKGYGWTKWYEPLCSTCHPTPDDAVTEVAFVETGQGDLLITRTNGRYTITVGGIIRHPNLDADGVARAMANYLHGSEYALKKHSRGE